MEITKTGEFKASFDLTDFGSSSSFREVMDETELERNWKYTGRGFEFIGINEDVTVHTYNNPITGESDGPVTDRSHGYASYIHIIGDTDRVSEVYTAIIEHSRYTKGKSLGEWIV